MTKLTELLYTVSETILKELIRLYPNSFRDIENTIYSIVDIAEEQQVSSIFHRYTNDDLVLCFELVTIENGWFLVDYTVGDWKVDDVLDITNCSSNKEEFPNKLLNGKVGKVITYLNEDYIFSKLNKWIKDEKYVSWD